MPIPQNQIMISSAITDNPFRILGVYSNATAKDIAANQGKMNQSLQRMENLNIQTQNRTKFKQ
jgi:hypothetical protein